jgi:calcineurin-like phosphoesterase family protein
MIISDTHFGHNNAIKWRPFKTIQEHDEVIYNNIIKTVNKNDVLWILGDVCLHPDSLHYVYKINVSCEAIDYTPISIEEIRQRIKEF